MILRKQMGKAVSRIVKDFQQKELIPLKILFFVQATTIAVLYPYLTIHMRALGINIEETSIMSAMIPVIGIFMPPLAGMVADKIGNFKILLSVSTLIGGLTALLLLVVPPGRARMVHPTEVVLDICCGSGRANVHIADGILCEGKPWNETNVDMTLRTCGVACPVGDPSGSSATDGLLKTMQEAGSYTVRIEKDDEVIRYNVTARERDDATETDYAESIRRISGGSYFFPFNGSYRMQCNLNVCSIGGSDGGNPSANGSAPAEPFPGRTLTLRYGSEAVPNFGNVSCVEREKREDVKVSVHITATDTFELTQCESKCLATVRRKEVCANTETEVVYDPNLTFWVYFVVRVLIGVTGSTTYSMFEVAVIAILREHKADYGLQRIYSSIGGMVASPLTGFLIDYASEGKIGTDYSPAFYLYAGLKILASLLILLINLEFKQSAKSVVADFFKVIRNAEVLSLMASCFVLGSTWGYIESFLFWFLEDLGGNRSLMGITVTVGGLAGIPLLIFSGPIIGRLGHANVIFIGFIFYAIRLLGYSLIYNPYDCLYFEAMESITSSLAITAAITYGAKLSTTTTDGSIQGLVGGLYYGVGKGAGTLIGGYLMKSYGTRATYRIFAAFALGTGFIYFLLNQCYIRKLPNREDNDICKKEPKKPKEEPKVVTEKETQENKNEGYVQTEDESQARTKDE